MTMALLAIMNTIYGKIESTAVRLNIDAAKTLRGKKAIHNAVGRWITVEEYKEITSKEFLD